MPFIVAITLRVMLALRSRRPSLAGALMDIYKKTDALAKKLEAEYPAHLAGRLRWWSKKLGIDQVRLLRMIGMSARQAKECKGERLERVLRIPLARRTR